MQTCPKCQYVRKPSDAAPDWQCPSCGIVYAKFGTAPHGNAHNLEAEVPEDHTSANTTSHINKMAPIELAPRPGTVSQTTAQLARVALLQGVLAIGPFALVFAGLIHVIPLSSLAVTLYALPWIAIALVAVFGEWLTYQLTFFDNPIFGYTIFGKKPEQGPRKLNPPKASVSLLIFVPAMALLSLSGSPYPDESSRLPIYSLIGGATMVAVAFGTCPSLRKHWFTGVWMFPVACIYSAGAAISINGWYDRTQPTVDIMEIESKYETRSGRNNLTHHLMFLVHDADDPQRTHEVEVSESLYGMKKLGDKVCKFRRPGFLRMPWSRVSECPN